MKHAWLIIAHNEFAVLQRLISLLDHERSDFFVHIDAKVRDLPTLKVEKGRLFILEKRMDVRWGSVSQIETELVLLEYAQKKGPYSHYHIISGTHLPLKSIDELTRFYDAHQNEEILRLWPADEGDADFKLRRFHFPLRHYKSRHTFQRRLCQLTWQCVIKAQKILGIRHLKKASFIKTDNWLSLTEEACKYLVQNKMPILKKYKWSFCGDEYFIATELSPYPERFRFHDCPNLLFVIFERENPESFSLDDFPRLQQTGFWWARKFTNGDAN